MTVHEQGHSYGLSHSHSNLCTQVITGTCTYDEYGDAYDAMGSSPYVGHFSASQKDRLGWLTDREVDLTGGGVAALEPMAADGVGPHANRIRTSTDRVYWIEYRQALDFDRDLPVEGLDGVQVRVSGAGSGGATGCEPPRHAPGRRALAVQRDAALRRQPGALRRAS